jgi:hypothetical protein
VRAAVLDALQQDRADILRETVHYQGLGGLAGSTSTSWIYPAFPAVGQRVRYRQVDYSKGEPGQDVESIYTEDEALEHLSMSTTQGPRSAKIVGVDYQTRTWATFTTSTVLVSLTMSPALIHAQIASGNFTVDGTVKLDGHDAVKLHWTQNLGPAAAFRTTMWVDATTYVPLRLVNVRTVGPHISFTTTIGFAMIPATGASMKALTPPVPAGFTRAAQIPGYSRIGG